MNITKEQNIYEKIDFLLKHIHLLKTHELIYNTYKIESLVVSILTEPSPLEECRNYTKICQLSQRIKNIIGTSRILTENSTLQRLESILEKVVLKETQKIEIIAYLHTMILKNKITFIYENSLNLDLYEHLEKNKTILEMLYEILESESPLVDLDNYKILSEYIKRKDSKKVIINKKTKLEKTKEIIKAVYNQLTKMGTGTDLKKEKEYEDYEKIILLRYWQ